MYAYEFKTKEQQKLKINYERWKQVHKVILGSCKSNVK